ncbi:MAG: DUF4382 domain-containing protein [Chitinophagaceae bacterium]|nr:DUF4382 domain-containing protein [Chitinophagaceae bacterium]
MKQFRRICLALGIIALFVILINSCKKESSESVAIPEGQQRIRIRLSDNPVNYDAVNVDIQQVIVQIIPDSCRGRGDNNGNDCYDDDEYRCSVWDTLDIRPGVYNLLDLSNGADTLLASGLTIEGRINKIKLVLGTNNSVVIDSVSYPLTLWNNNRVWTIQVKGRDIFEITPNDLQLWLDFDAGASIVKVSNNRFVLKPRIKIFVPAQTASIKGKILPRQAEAVVAAYTATDTLVAIPDHGDGRFKIRGIRDSVATVFINATANGYRDTTILNVPLRRGEETNIGTIQLRQ